MMSSNNANGIWTSTNGNGSLYRIAMSTWGREGLCLVPYQPRGSFSDGDDVRGPGPRRRSRSPEISKERKSKKSCGEGRAHKLEVVAAPTGKMTIVEPGGGLKPSTEKVLKKAMSSSSSCRGQLSTPGPVLATALKKTDRDSGHKVDEEDGVVPILEGRSISNVEFFFRKACHDARLVWEVELNKQFDKKKRELEAKQKDQGLTAQLI